MVEIKNNVITKFQFRIRCCKMLDAGQQELVCHCTLKSADSHLISIPV